MAYRLITHIRLSDESTVSTENITHLKFHDASIETVAQAVKNIDDGHLYYYLTKDGQSPEIGSVHPLDDCEPYIRTKIRSKFKDKLLSLPRF